MDFAEHVWLGALSGRLGKSEMKAVIENIRYLMGKEDKELADSVLEVSASANMQIVKEMMGDDNMYDTLMELMGPRIELIVKERTEELERSLEQGRKDGICGTIKTLRNFGHNDLEIKAAIMNQYNLSEKDAEEYLKNV